MKNTAPNKAIKEAYRRLVANRENIKKVCDSQWDARKSIAEINEVFILLLESDDPKLKKPEKKQAPKVA